MLSDEGWLCAICEFHNPPARQVTCERCRSKRTVLDEAPECDALPRGWRLVLLDSELPIADGDPLRIGRDPAWSPRTAGLLASHVVVSRQHAELEACADGLVVRDAGSSNGVYVDGERIVGSRLVTTTSALRLGASAQAVDAVVEGVT